MYAVALRSLLVAHVILRTPGVKLSRTTQESDASLGALLRTLQSSRNDVTFWTRGRHEKCSIPAKELVVHMSTVPNSGTTWTQYLFEEATGIITQHNKLTTRTQKKQSSTCRGKNGVSESVARLAMNDELELYKAHYPGLPGTERAMTHGMNEAMTIFVPSSTAYPVSRSLVIVRNPIDAFLAASRHLSPNSDEKVSDQSPLQHSSSACTKQEAKMRPETIGEWLDPEGYNAQSNISTKDTAIEDEFRNYVKLWVRFVAYWFQFTSTACMDVTMVRYEDLSDSDRNLDTFSVLVNAFNSSVSSTAIERATSTYPPSTGSTYHAFANASFDDNKTLQAFASECLGERDLMSALGYEMFLERIIS